MAMPAFFAEPLFLVIAAIAFAAAAVRGFSGFGSGLIFMPIGAACLGPKDAAGTLFIIDTILILPFVSTAIRKVAWRELAPLGIASMLAVPLGAVVLLHADPAPLRWGISLAIIASVGVLAAGWRYHGPTRVWMSALVGCLAGFMSGAAQIPGPPVLIYWLGRGTGSATMRANAMVFFMATTIVSGIAFALGGVFTTQVAGYAAALFPIYAIGIFLGGRMFGWASETTYRRIAYAAILASAVISMPVFG
jgi:uncharacterized membrane protein YfcA